MIKPNANIRDTDQSQPACSTSLSPDMPTALIVCDANDCRREGTLGFYRIGFANAGGGDNRDRTDDPLLAKQVLSQLSYAPNPWNSPYSEQDHPIPNLEPRFTGLKHHRSPS
jgi:hypothetical protein